MGWSSTAPFIRRWKMREIKFRAWHSKTKIMYCQLNAGEEGSKAEPDLCISFKGKVYAIGFSGDGMHEEKFLTDNMILMQYTGLKDKNKKEIYEGDIVKRYNRADNIHACLVVWNDGHLAYGLKSKSNNTQLLSDFYDQNGNELEIISNIHDNPELLKRP